MPAASETFGAYRLLEHLARGGMADVYRARMDGTAGFQKTVAIKKILPELTENAEFVRLFIDEARVAVQLTHPNIVRLYELNEEAGQLFMALEYVDGNDLSRLQVLRAHHPPMPVELCVYIVGEILKGLAYAHTRLDASGHPQRIVHCDVSPHNVLVSHAGEVKVADFGISRAAFRSADAAGSHRGKLAYMSPEQIRGEDLDGRSDVFSSGIVLYELLTGTRLFKAGTPERTRAKVCGGIVPDPRACQPDIPPRLVDVLRRALEVEPAARFPSATHFLEALTEVAVQQGLRGSATELASVTRRWAGDAPHTAPAASETKPICLLMLNGSSLARTARSHGARVLEEANDTTLAMFTGDAMRDAIGSALQTLKSLGPKATGALVPGLAALDPSTLLPRAGWDLDGPFYLVRWLHSRSQEQQTILSTGAAAMACPDQPMTPVARIQTKKGTNLVIVALT